MFEMSGLENYQVAIVRGKGKRQPGAMSGDGKCPVQTELWRASKTQNPMLPWYSQRCGSEEQHMNFSDMCTSSYTPGSGQRHSSTHFQSPFGQVLTKSPLCARQCAGSNSTPPGEAGHMWKGLWGRGLQAWKMQGQDS
jgi:hypothetical protein